MENDDDYALKAKHEAGKSEKVERNEKKMKIENSSKS